MIECFRRHCLAGGKKKEAKIAYRGPVTGGKTNFALYLEEQLADPGFARRFEEAGEAWAIALQSTLRRPCQRNLNCLKF
jgi:hypothetical protein